MDNPRTSSGRSASMPGASSVDARRRDGTGSCGNSTSWRWCHSSNAVFGPATALTHRSLHQARHGAEPRRTFPSSDMRGSREVIQILKQLKDAGLVRENVRLQVNLVRDA